MHPLQEQRDTVRDLRQIGLGVLGIADMLIKLGVRYGSDESLNICDKIGFVMANIEQYILRDFGTFPNYKKCILNCAFYFRKYHSNKRIIEKIWILNIITTDPHQ